MSLVSSPSGRSGCPPLDTRLIEVKRSRVRNKNPQHTEPNSVEHPIAHEPKAVQSTDAELCIAAPTVSDLPSATVVVIRR